MSLVDDHDIRTLREVLDLCGARLGREIGVGLDDHVRELTAIQIGQLVFDLGIPHGILASLGGHDEHVLALAHGVILGEHEADERLAEADAIGEEPAVPQFRHLHEGVECLALVRGEHRVDHRLRLLPRLVRRVGVGSQSLESFRVHLKRRELANVVVEHGEQLGVNRGGRLPVVLIPLLQLDDFGALEAHVKLDVLCESWARKVR